MESVIKDEKPPEVVIHHEEKVDFIPSDIGLSDMEATNCPLLRCDPKTSATETNCHFGKGWNDNARERR